MKQGWSFLNFWRKPLPLSVNCWRGGLPIEGEQEGESQPFRGWKGWGGTYSRSFRIHLPSVTEELTN